MTLAKQIIYGNNEDVARTLAHEEDINVIDEYGYTPLIQTAIVNSLSKAQLLIDAGAQIDFPDLTGRTALNWAASNNNYGLCKLLLQKGANSNAYTNAGQAVLVIPYLKQYNSIRRLLTKNGANLDFALDFINAKLMGHRFELEGRADIVDTNNTFIEMELEGFYLEFSLNMLLHSLQDFTHNFGGKNLVKYFPKFEVIISALQNAANILQYQNYLIDVEKNRKQIDTLLNANPLILPILFAGHAITLIKFWDILIRCDRGEFGRKNGTVIGYQINNPHALTKTFIKHLLYRRQDPEFINSGLQEYLDLEPMWQMKLPPQISGNCSWANVEAAIPAIIFTLFLDEQSGKKVKTCHDRAIQIYNEWINWDQERSLDSCIQSFHEALPIRQASIATLLAATLFQRLQYHNPQDRARAEKILPLITQPKYQYILKSYIKVFSRAKNNEMLRNLHEFLDDFGVEL